MTQARCLSRFGDCVILMHVNLRLPDVLMIVALILAVAWLATVGFGLRLPLGLPRNLLIWLAIGAAGMSFVMTWRELNRTTRRGAHRDEPPGRKDKSS